MTSMESDRTKVETSVPADHQHYIDQTYSTAPVLRPSEEINVSEILTHIFLFLPAHASTLGSVSCVSHGWRDRSEFLPQGALMLQPPASNPRHFVHRNGWEEPCYYHPNANVFRDDSSDDDSGSSVEHGVSIVGHNPDRSRWPFTVAELESLFKGDPPDQTSSEGDFICRTIYIAECQLPLRRALSHFHEATCTPAQIYGLYARALAVKFTLTIGLFLAGAAMLSAFGNLGGVLLALTLGQCGNIFIGVDMVSERLLTQKLWQLEEEQGFPLRRYMAGSKILARFVVLLCLLPIVALAGISGRQRAAANTPIVNVTEMLLQSGGGVAGTEPTLKIVKPKFDSDPFIIWWGSGPTSPGNGSSYALSVEMGRTIARAPQINTSQLQASDGEKSDE